MYTHQEKLYRFKGILALQEHDLAIAMQGVNQQVAFQMTNQPSRNDNCSDWQRIRDKNPRNLSNPQQNSYSVNYFYEMEVLYIMEKLTYLALIVD